MKNKSNEELQKEFQRLTVLMVSKMNNLSILPQSELAVVHMDLYNIEKEKNAIKLELENRTLN